MNRRKKNLMALKLEAATIITAPTLCGLHPAAGLLFGRCSLDRRRSGWLCEWPHALFVQERP